MNLAASRRVSLLWPPDDTEESVVGTDFHQMTIINVRVGINEIARAGLAPDQPTPWQALSQTMVLGFAHPDGTPYTTLPDVFVYTHPIAQQRGSVWLDLDGPPVLIVEVASESTYTSDLNLRTGKGWTYAHGGVREYLVLDPGGLFLRERIRAWRLETGEYAPWHPEADGRWHSREIAVAFTVEDGQAAVYSGRGRRQLREGEITAALDRANEELARKDAELADKDTALADLRRRLAERGNHNPPAQE